MVSNDRRVFIDMAVSLNNHQPHLLLPSSSSKKELNEFQSSELGSHQGRDDYTDTRRVAEMLKAQSQLKHDMEDYVAEHHEETYMADAWGNASSGLGLGLW